MKKTAAAAGYGGGGTAIQQRGWAFLVIFLLSGCFVVVNQVQAQKHSETVAGKHPLIELNEDNWRLMLEGEWMVEFFAPWCPACKSLAPIWDRFSEAAVDINVNVARIDVTTSPSLSGRFFVTALPTIYHVKDGEFRQYRGSRDSDTFVTFITERKWSKLEAISAWKKPDTIHMSILSYFFKLSHSLKDFNGRLQEEYGLPTWGSYAIFAIATIFVGAGLGLVLVCIVDFLYPPKKSQRQSFSESKENAQNGIEDIAQDEIEDDVPQNEDEDDKDDATEDQEDEDEDDEDNEEEDNEDAASTDDEKQQTQSESEEPESEKKPQQQQQEPEKKESADNTKPSPTEARKRKPRKAD